MNDLNDCFLAQPAGVSRDPIEAHITYTTKLTEFVNTTNTNTFVLERGRIDFLSHFGVHRGKIGSLARDRPLCVSLRQARGIEATTWRLCFRLETFIHRNGH